MSPLTSISKIYYAFLTAYLLIPSITASTDNTPKTYTLKTGPDQKEKTYKLCVEEVDENKILGFQKIFHYSFEETTTTTKLTCDEFINIGARYVTDPSATNLFHGLIDKISSDMKEERVKKSSRYNLEASIKEKNGPIIFTLQIRNKFQEVFRAPDHDSHFGDYLKRWKEGSALAIASLKQNILIIPKRQLDTLWKFNSSTPKEEKRHFWTLFFSFLFKYSENIDSISIKTKNPSEQAIRHLHVRLRTNPKLKNKIKKKVVIGMYTDEVIPAKEKSDGFLVLGDPSPNKNEEEEIERNITIRTTTSSRLSDAVPSLNFFLLLFLTGIVLWLIKKNKKMPVQSPEEDTSSNTYPKQ